MSRRTRLLNKQGDDLKIRQWIAQRIGYDEKSILTGEGIRIGKRHKGKIKYGIRVFCQEMRSPVEIDFTASDTAIIPLIQKKFEMNPNNSFRATIRDNIMSNNFNLVIQEYIQSQFPWISGIKVLSGKKGFEIEVHAKGLQKLSSISVRIGYKTVQTIYENLHKLSEYCFEKVEEQIPELYKSYLQAAIKTERNICKEKIIEKVSQIYGSPVIYRNGYYYFDYYGVHLKTKSSLSSAKYVKLEESEHGLVKSYSMDMDIFVNDYAERICKKLIGSKTEIEIVPNSVIPNTVKCLKEINTIAYPLYNQILHIQPKDLIFTIDKIDKENLEISWQTKWVSGSIVNGVEYVNFSDEYRDISNDSKQSLYLECKAFAQDQFAKNGLSVKYITGMGILYGSTQVLVGRDTDATDNTIVMTMNMPLYKNDEGLWRNTLLKYIKDAENAIDQNFKKKCQEYFKEHKLALGNMLCRDIIQFIAKNEEYITEAAVVAAMRGTKIKLKTHIHYTEGCGKYAGINAEKVKEYISLLEKYISRKSMRGTYGTFETLHLSDEGKACYEKMASSWLFKEWDVWKDTDLDVMNFCDQINRKAVITMSDYLYMLDIIKAHYTYICRFYMHYISMFENAPDEIKTYTHMMERMETDKNSKNILNDIVQIIKGLSLEPPF